MKTMETKIKLAKEYATLKRASWEDQGVTNRNNSKNAHLARAMRFMSKKDIELQNEILTKKIIENTK